jgi:beta-phosphoglucomutase-like phosphatase (HAD superfamily)
MPVIRSAPSSEQLAIRGETSVPATAGTAVRAMNPFEYHAWLVDLDGTLYYQTAVRAMLAIELVLRGWSAIKILQAFRHEHERMRGEELVCGSDPFHLQVRRTAHRLNIPEGCVATVVERWMFDRPGRWLRAYRRRAFLRAIASYRARGGRTALVSDYPARRKLAAMGLAEQFFDEIVACGEPGGPSGLKPLPSGLLLAAERLAATAAECLVIGDRWDADAEAARRANMAFRHITDFT